MLYVLGMESDMVRNALVLVLLLECSQIVIGTPAVLHRAYLYEVVKPTKTSDR